MDFATQAQEMKAIGGQPDYALGSVRSHDRRRSSDRLGLWKPTRLVCLGCSTRDFCHWRSEVVRTLAAAHERIYKHSLILEDARAYAVYGQNSSVGKVLEIHQETPGRIHIVVIRRSIGF